MPPLAQTSVPGIVGISTYVDCVYHKELQREALRAAGANGPINRLITVTVTLDFGRLIANVRSGRLDEAEEQVADTCTDLQAAGADFIVVTSGTTSTLTARARERVAIPFLDLAEAAWHDVATDSASVGLLSTRRTVEGGIFQAAAERHGARLVTPAPPTAERVDEAIFDELIYGRVTEATLHTLSSAIAELAGLGAQAVILGNTDMTLAADRLREEAPVPLVDSARAHARAAARAALAGRL